MIEDSAVITKRFMRYDPKNKEEKEFIEIRYLGHIFRTSQWLELSDERYRKLLEDILPNPSIESVRKEFVDFFLGRTNSHKNIHDYYIRDIMYDTKYHKSHLSVNEFLASKTICGIYNGKIRMKENFFERKALAKNFIQVMDVGAGHVCKKVSNFKISSAEEILNDFQYSPKRGNNNWYDYSCGWGTRLLAALRQGVNYYGTDTNHLLYEKLVEIAKEFNECNSGYLKEPRFTDIRCQGAQQFVPEWEGIMDLCFSSPPYFFLEDYKHGDQSWKPGMSYQEWLDSFMVPVIQNCFRYLHNNGVLMINTKNFAKYPIYDDSIQIAKDAGFFLVEEKQFKNEQRYKYIDGKAEFIDTNENISVMCKSPHFNRRERKQLSF